MPSSLYTDGLHRTSDAQPTIDRVNALLDRFDVDAIESIWNPNAVAEAPAQLTTVALERLAAEPDERALADAFSNRYLLPLFDPPPEAALPIDPAVAERLDASYCWEHQIAPLAEEAQTLEVAIAFPQALQLADDFQRRFGKQLRPLFAPQSVIERILHLLYPREVPGLSPAARQRVAIQKPSEVKERRQRLIHALLAAALNRRATAVHFERRADRSQVRFRISGRLAVWEEIPSSQVAETLAGLKIRAKLDAGDLKSAQSGLFQIRKGTQRILVRLDTCPTVDGERTVLHFEDTANGLGGLDRLGLDKRHRAELRSWLTQAPGLILVSSPAGHGTSTTLYSLLREAERPEAGLATIESKVERRLQRVQQLQIAEPHELTFPDGLRALLKQDLDVIMVSDIRSAEMVDLCLQGCSAGCTMIAGLPAQNPLALIQRMLIWGLDRRRLTAELRGIVFQRLLRKLCCHCRKPQVVDRMKRQRYGIPPDCTLYQPVGCTRCSGRGYSGRLAVFELLDRHSELLRLLGSDVPSEHFQKPHFPSVSSDVSQAAIRRAIAGETSLAEAVRLIGG